MDNKTNYFELLDGSKLEGFPYGRNGKAIAPLTLNKIEQIKITAKEKDYIDNKGLNNVYYKDYILY